MSNHDKAYTLMCRLEDLAHKMQGSAHLPPHILEILQLANEVLPQCPAYAADPPANGEVDMAMWNHAVNSMRVNWRHDADPQSPDLIRMIASSKGWHPPEIGDSMTITFMGRQYKIERLPDR